MHAVAPHWLRCVSAEGHLVGPSYAPSYVQLSSLSTLDVIHVTFWTRLSPSVFFLAGQRSYVELYVQRCERAWESGYNSSGANREQTDWQTDTQTHKPSTVTLAAHACRGWSPFAFHVSLIFGIVIFTSLSPYIHGLLLLYVSLWIIISVLIIRIWFSSPFMQARWDPNICCSYI